MLEEQPVRLIRGLEELNPALLPPSFLPLTHLYVAPRPANMLVFLPGSLALSRLEKH